MIMKTDKTDKMEEILSRRYVIDKGFSGSDEYIYNSMQEHTDQAIEEFKRKLKAQCEAYMQLATSSQLFTLSELSELIDTTQP
jgi:hypothetical protein